MTLRSITSYTHTHTYAGPVLRRLEARGEWGSWRTLASLALLYHHGGVLVPPARYRPLRSLDCFSLGGGGLQVDLQAASLGLVEEVVGGGRGTAAAWGPDLGLVAAPRHDATVRRAVERLFFEGDGGGVEEAVAVMAARVLALLRGGGDDEADVR